MEKPGVKRLFQRFFTVIPAEAGIHNYRKSGFRIECGMTTNRITSNRTQAQNKITDIAKIVKQPGLFCKDKIRLPVIRQLWVGGGKLG